MDLENDGGGGYYVCSGHCSCFIYLASVQAILALCNCSHHANSFFTEAVGDQDPPASALCQASSGLPQLCPMRRLLPDLTVWEKIILCNPVSKLSTNAGVALGKDADMRDAASSLTLAVAERGINTTPARCVQKVRSRYGSIILQALGDE
jgi:hypothetical protein